MKHVTVPTQEINHPRFHVAVEKSQISNWKENPPIQQKKWEEPWLLHVLTIQVFSLSRGNCGSRGTELNQAGRYPGVISGSPKLSTLETPTFLGGRTYTHCLAMADTRSCGQATAGARSQIIKVQRCVATAPASLARPHEYLRNVLVVPARLIPNHHTLSRWKVAGAACWNRVKQEDHHILSSNSIETQGPQYSSETLLNV